MRQKIRPWSASWVNRCNWSILEVQNTCTEKQFPGHLGPIRKCYTWDQAGCWPEPEEWEIQKTAIIILMASVSSFKGLLSPCTGSLFSYFTWPAFNKGNMSLPFAHISINSLFRTTKTWKESLEGAHKRTVPHPDVVVQPGIPALRSLMQDCSEFKACLHYKVRLCLKSKTKINK